MIDNGRVDVADAVARAAHVVKLQQAVIRLTHLLAGLSFDEQAAWLIHAIAALDPCETPDRFGEAVLQRVKADVDRRIESGQW